MESLRRLTSSVFDGNSRLGLGKKSAGPASPANGVSGTGSPFTTPPVSATAAHDTRGLDVTFITERLLVMGFPVLGPTNRKQNQNNIEELATFLEAHFANQYLIFNLNALEDGVGGTDSAASTPTAKEQRLRAGSGALPLASLVGKSTTQQIAEYVRDQMLEFAWERDGMKAHTPPLDLIFRICYAIFAWLSLDPNNVACIHCQSGRTRSGVVVACYLLFARLADNPTDAFVEFYQKRWEMKNLTAHYLKKKTPPSIQRFLSSFHTLIEHQRVPNEKPLLLKAIIFRALPVDHAPCVQIWDDYKMIFCSETMPMAVGSKDARDAPVIDWNADDGFLGILWENGIDLDGGFSILCSFGDDYDADENLDPSTRVLFRYADSTWFLSPGLLTLKKNDMDMMKQYEFGFEEEQFSMDLVLHDSPKPRRNYVRIDYTGNNAVRQGLIEITKHHLVLPDPAMHSNFLRMGFGETPTTFALQRSQNAPNVALDLLHSEGIVGCFPPDLRALDNSSDGTADQREQQAGEPTNTNSPLQRRQSTAEIVAMQSQRSRYSTPTTTSDTAICQVCKEDDYMMRPQLVKCMGRCGIMYHTTCVGLKKIPFGLTTLSDRTNHAVYVKKYFSAWECDKCTPAVGSPPNHMTVAAPSPTYPREYERASLTALPPNFGGSAYPINNDNDSTATPLEVSAPCPRPRAESDNPDNLEKLKEFLAVSGISVEELLRAATTPNFSISPSPAKFPADGAQHANAQLDAPPAPRAGAAKANQRMQQQQVYYRLHLVGSSRLHLRTQYRLLYELVTVVVHTKLTRQDVITVLKETELKSNELANSMLTDLLWMIGNEVEMNERGRERHTSTEWQNLARLVKTLADEEIVPLLTLKSSLEVDLLHSAGLAPEPQALNKKVVRINTKTLYTQVKYNLLREESEGFSKVLSLLHTGVTKDQLEATKTDLLGLIGFFDLDANRVLDLVLDVYEMHANNDCFAELLDAFKKESLPHILGFKFQFYMRDSVSELKTPQSLYRLAAMLISKNLLTLESLLPHLSPSKDKIVEAALAHVEAMTKEAKSFGKVNLAAKVKDDSEEPEKETSTDADEQNQVYGLIMGMLEIGSDKRAFEMIRWFQSRGVNPLTYKPLSQQMCTLVHALVQSLYEPLSLRTLQLVPESSRAASVDSAASQYVKPLSSYDEFLPAVFPILKMLGAQLYVDHHLFTKLLRILSHMMEKQQKVKKASTPEADSILAKVKPLITDCFLPALSLHPSSPSLAFQLWDLIKLYPCDERYRMYQHWQNLYPGSPEMQLVEAKCVQSTRRVMRRLTADRAKPSARSLTHVAHSNPLIVFRTMLRQIQSYDNLIQPVVDAFKFVTPLGMDALSFVLVSELSMSRQSMKADGTNISLWLASLANFSGSFYRKYPNVELSGLLQYLIQRLQNWESVDLVVLSELLSKMGSCISFEDISLSQVEAQAGGPHLWHEPTDPKLMNRRAIPRLREALIKGNLALPLCVLICQVRSKIEFQEDSAPAHLKLLGRLFDTCQMTLSQLLQFLNGAVDPGVYTDMMPSLHSLVHEYHVPAELAMTMSRPCIRFDDPVLRRTPRSINASTGSSSASASSSGRRTWFMQSPELIEDVAKAMVTPEKDPFTGMTKEMYIAFWSLILYDVHIPFPQYEAEIIRLRNSAANAANSGANANLSSSERKKLKEKTTQMIDKLTNEQKDQVAHRKRVYERLEELKVHFFKSEGADHKQHTSINELLQRCVIPRALLSPEDALFCAKFMERIHYINTPEFSTLQYYHKINLKLPAIVLCVTEREAGNFGFFFKETLQLLHRWYQNGVVYEEEALHGKDGFSIDLRDKKTLSHRQYKQFYARWHKSMEKVFSRTLESGEYMPIRNTLVVLTKIIDVFPASKAIAENLVDLVSVLTNEEREDIKIMAKRYHALLTKRKTSLVEDKALGPRNRKLAEGDDKPVASSKGTPRSGSSSRQDVENGEVTDPVREPSEERNGRSSAAPSRLKRRESDRSGTDERPSDDRRGGRRDGRGGSQSRSSEAPSSKRSDADRENLSGQNKRDREKDRDNRETRERENRETRERETRDRDRERERERSRDRDRERGVGREIRERERSKEPAAPRSASTDSRRSTREKEAEDGREPGSKDVRDLRDANESRKRQRTEQTEAALRRQLTEKKAKDSARPADESVKTGVKDISATKEATSEKAKMKEQDRSKDKEQDKSEGKAQDKKDKPQERTEDKSQTKAQERPKDKPQDKPQEKIQEKPQEKPKEDRSKDKAQDKPKEQERQTPRVRKMVSLVPRKREREGAPSEEPKERPQGQGQSSNADSGDSGHSNKRRREGGDGGGGNRGGHDNRGGGRQQHSDGNDKHDHDDKRNKRMNNGGGGNNNSGNSGNKGGGQQRDSSNRSRYGGGGQGQGSRAPSSERSHGGGGGNGNNSNNNSGRRRDNNNNNNDRRQRR